MTPLERIRQLCLGLPAVTERLSHGEPTWFVNGKKTFVMFADHHHDDRLACWLAAPAGAQQELVAADPARFFVPPYVGTRGWIGLRLDVSEDRSDEGARTGANGDTVSEDRSDEGARTGANGDTVSEDRSDEGARTGAIDGTLMPLDWVLIAELVTDAYRTIAPAKLVAQLS